MLTSRNNKAVKNFMQSIEITMASFGQSTMKQAAKRGLQKMVNEAGFNDYTGKLINSYQAAILTKGGIAERMAKAKNTETTEKGINSTGRNPILMTSYGLPGTTEISHEDRTRAGFRMRKRRDGGESTDVRRGHIVNGKMEKSYGSGYGQYITRIKGIAPPISQGYWLVFDNGASNVRNKNSKYPSVAHEVHSQGPIQHKVFPDKGLDLNLFGIGQQELKRAIARARRR